MDRRLDERRPALMTKSLISSHLPVRKPGFSWVFWVIPLLFLLFFYILPMGAIFQYILAAPAKLGNIPTLLERIWNPLKFTIWQAFLSTLFTLIIGLPAAFVFGRLKFPGKKLMRILTTIPFIMPTVVVAAGFSALLGPRGWLNSLLMSSGSFSQPPVQVLNSLAAIILAHVFYNTTIFIRVLGGAWGQLDTKIEYAARSLGAADWPLLKTVTLPLLKPAFLSSLLLVFLFDFTSFAVILLLGGPGFATLEVEIYTQALHMLNLPMAGLLSLVQLVFTLVITIVYSRLNRLGTVQLSPRDPEEIERVPSSLFETFLLWSVNILLFLILLLPLLSLVVRSIISPQLGLNQNLAFFDHFSIRYYLSIFENTRGSLFYVPPGAAIFNSLLFGLLTSLFTLILGFFAAKALSATSSGKRFFDSLLMLPLGTSAVTLGLGFLLVFNKPPFDAGSFILLVPLAHTLVALPFVVRILQPAISSIPSIYRQSAAVLGASPWIVWWKIEFPLLRRAFLSAGIFAFTISLGEFGATTFLSRPDMPTIPVAIYRYLSQPGSLNYGQALAMATLLMIICTVAIIVVEKFRLPALSDF